MGHRRVGGGDRRGVMDKYSSLMIRYCTSKKRVSNIHQINTVGGDLHMGLHGFALGGQNVLGWPEGRGVKLWGNPRWPVVLWGMWMGHLGCECVRTLSLMCHSITCGKVS